MKQDTNNILIMTDSYKVSHWKQYPKGMERGVAYYEARSGAEYPYTNFFGLQYILKKYFEGNSVITLDKINEASDFWKAHFGSDTVFNRQGWLEVLKDFNGTIPLRISAVPEGSVIPVSNVLFKVELTADLNKYGWLLSWVEPLLMQVWYPTTVATRSRVMKEVILQALEKSGTPSDIAFKLHDFGFRGATSYESAALGGAAHLINFKGTDTIGPAMYVLSNYYQAKEMMGFSIPAYEHSTVTAWGRAREFDCYRNALDEFPDGLLAIVIDSWDTMEAVKFFCSPEIVKKVKSRNGTVVLRSDSGDPRKLLPDILDLLYGAYGGKLNQQKYLVLDSHIRVIQSDGINDKNIVEIMDAVMDADYSVDNLVFGSGGGLLQDMTRDTMRFAGKLSEVTVDGVRRDVYKEPATDPTKRSKKGNLKLVKFSDGYHTLRVEEPGEDLLVPVFDNGTLLVTYNIEDIIKRADIH